MTTTSSRLRHFRGSLHRACSANDLETMNRHTYEELKMEFRGRLVGLCVVDPLGGATTLARACMDRGKGLQGSQAASLFPAVQAECSRDVPPVRPGAGIPDARPLPLRAHWHCPCKGQVLFDREIPRRGMRLSFPSVDPGACREVRDGGGGEPAAQASQCRHRYQRELRAASRFRSRPRWRSFSTR